MFFSLAVGSLDGCSILSENARLRNLQERIVDVARNERAGLLIVPMGVFLVSAGLVISVVGNSSFAYAGGPIAIALGLVSTMFGFFVSVHYAHQYNTLLRELDTAHLTGEATKQ